MASRTTQIQSAEWFYEDVAMSYISCSNRDPGPCLVELAEAAVQAGQELADRYRLDRRLGQGGMGEVWSATDLRLDRAVAVKVMLGDMAGERAGVALAWFRREGKATARLNHPHIAVIHDAGEHETCPYLVMELIQGPDLRKLLRSSPGGLPGKREAGGISVATALTALAFGEAPGLSCELWRAAIESLPGEQPPAGLQDTWLAQFARSVVAVDQAS